MRKAIAQIHQPSTTDKRKNYRVRMWMSWVH